jgi:catechol 2,3-dioxygenase-like lactoylglutathione lyase family enzyme
MIRIKLMSVIVYDQAKALDFYTRVLGFRTKHDSPLGEYRWLTVTNSDDQKRSAAHGAPRPAALVDAPESLLSSKGHHHERAQRLNHKLHAAR